jgi:ABC-type nitrate/sulfonate/bicarbonate transport system permease component
MKAAASNYAILGAQLVIVLAAAGVWEVLSRFEFVSPDLLPPLSVVLVTLWQLLHDPHFLTDIRVTLVEVIASFVIVAPISIIVGFFLAETPALARLVNPVFHALMAIPKSIFLPIFILALGIGFTQKIVFGAVLAFFVIVVYAEAAVASIPSGYVALGRAIGASRVQIYTRIYLPAMLPLIIAGLRIGFIFVVTGVLLAEMYSASVGLGREIVHWGEYYEISKLLAAVLLIMMTCVVINQLLEAWERSAGAGRLDFGAAA